MRTTRSCSLSSYRLLGALVLAVALAASSTGCVSKSSTVGMSLPTLSAGERVDGALVTFEGVVRVDAQGCLMVDVTDPGGDSADRWAVWPAGAEEIYGATPGGDNGVLVEGRRYVRGDPITGTGRLVALQALPGGGEGGGYFRGSGTYCDAADAGVLVMDTIEPSPGAASPG